jgi:uncharacterized integral membrane protein (TIGR00697 family)
MADRHPFTRRERLFITLAGVFLVNAIVAEVVGGKLFAVNFMGTVRVLSVGVLLWPVVFVTSDVVNEYFGRAGVRRLSILGAILIAYVFVALWACGLPAALSFSPVGDAEYEAVFFQSRWIIVGSITAFLVAQLVDVTVFWVLRRQTGARLLWLRATGSTVVSQLIDTVVVQFIGLHLPWRLSGGARGIDFDTFVNGAVSSYVFKFAVAVGVTPLLYVVHAVIDRYLGSEEAERLQAQTAAREGAG